MPKLWRNNYGEYLQPETRILTQSKFILNKKHIIVIGYPLTSHDLHSNHANSYKSTDS